MKFKALLVIMMMAVAGFWQSASAGETGEQDYLAWFKSANSRLRIASTYLRTGNIDFAALALEEITGSKPPEKMSASLSGLTTKMLKQSETALALIDNDQPQKARSNLLKLRDDLFQAHQKLKITVFDDCIWALNKRGPALWHYKKNKPDLNDPEQAKEVAAATTAYLAQLNTCDQQADASLKADADYTRIVTGARRSLERISSESLANRDGGQLYRFIIELRSFDRLLYFR